MSRTYINSGNLAEPAFANVGRGGRQAIEKAKLLVVQARIGENNHLYESIRNKGIVFIFTRLMSALL